jgi:hypothetical protein
MVYNPIFEEEISRDQELSELKKAIKLRASKEQLEDVYDKAQNFVKSHPIFTTLALGVFGLGLRKKA